MLVISEAGLYADELRSAIKDLMRTMGVLEGKKAFCCDCTFSQCHTIMEVGVQGKMSLIDLACRLNMDKSLMSRTVDDLVKKGYLKRQPDPNDRRYVVIELTDSGRELYQTIQTNSRRQFGAIVELIPEEERRMAVNGLKTVSQAMAVALARTEKFDR